MAGATIDHLISLIVLLGAILLFISLFNQTLQTAVLYQHHRIIATKCSDLLDNMLLNPGNPTNWGTNSCTLTGFGLQDPEFTQYELSPFSLMRLNYSLGRPIPYSKTGANYSNINLGFGESLLVPFNEGINYSTAVRLLGIDGTYGFGLAITPIVEVAISEVQRNPLSLAVAVTGNGFPLANANISYCVIAVNGQALYPSYTINSNSSTTDSQGLASLSFPSIDRTRQSFAIIAYARMSGLVGVGYYENALYEDNYAVPLIDDLNSRSIVIAHSSDVYNGSSSTIAYNATLVVLSEDFTLREIPLANSFGNIVSGPGNPYGNITILTDTPGILVITYQKQNDPANTGIAVMPWGISPLAFPVVFGENSLHKEWVATDTRQVTVSGIAYQAKLTLWSLEGYQVIS